MRELHALLDLLRLESVDDLSTDEAAFFARIDPMDPRVHELCHLTDQLAQFLETIARQEPRADSQT